MTTIRHMLAPPPAPAPLVAIESEQSVIGALLIDNAALARIAGKVTAADFADALTGRAYSRVFGAITELIDAGKPADPVTVFELLRDRGQDADAGGMAHLNDLAMCVPSASAIEQYAEVVADKSARRRALASGIELQGNSLADALDRAEAALASLRNRTEVPAPLFNVVPIDDLAHVEPPAPELWWGEWVPGGVVTLFSAHGGTGKSTVALMLAVSMAAGRPLFGIPTRQGRVAYYSAEDPGEVVRHRISKIMRGLGISLDDIGDRLHVIDATDFDPALYHEVTHAGVKSGHKTRAYDDLRRYLDAHQIDVLMVDNASDAFDANEIDRARVRGFMRALTSIAKERGGPVILLAHVDKSTSRGDRGPNSEGYSGSTAWHNSARSRWFMSRDKDGILTLEHQKHNLTRQAEPLRLMWPDGGIPQLDYVPNGFVQGIRDRADAKPLLKLIHEFTCRGEFVSTAETGPATVHAKLSGEAGFPKHLRKPADTMAAIRDAQRRGLLAREWHKTKDRKDKEHWALAPAGLALIGASAPVAPVAPVHGTDRIGAAAEPAAPVAPVLAHRGCGGELERAIGADGGAP